MKDNKLSLDELCEVMENTDSIEEMQDVAKDNAAHPNLTKLLLTVIDRTKEELGQ